MSSDDPRLHDPTQWWTIEQAAEATERDPRTIRRWIKEPGIRTMRPKRQLFLFMPDTFAAEQEMTGRIENPRRNTRGRFNT